MNHDDEHYLTLEAYLAMLGLEESSHVGMRMRWSLDDTIMTTIDAPDGKRIYPLDMLRSIHRAHTTLIDDCYGDET